VERESLRGSTADAGEAGELHDEILDDRLSTREAYSSPRDAFERQLVLQATQISSLGQRRAHSIEARS